MSIDYEVDAGVGIITLNRPLQKNAFTFEMVDEWAEIISAANDDPEVRVLVLTGAGGAFCSGVDFGSLQRLSGTPLSHREMLTRRVHRVALAVDRLEKPLLCAIVGAAVGAGLDMALMCDIRFAGESAKLSEGYIRVGLVPGDGGCYYLPRIVGIAKALELLWTGTVLDAFTARDLGIVSQVHPDAEVLDRTLELARRIASQPPVAVQLIKRSVYAGLRTHDLQTNLDLVASHMAVVMSTKDSHEAMSAFAEKRPGTFVGE